MRIVEVATHAADGHVGAFLGAHLQLLHAADLAFGIEDGDADARGIGESGESRLAGVAGGGGHDHDLLVSGAVVRARAGHEAGQHLEGDVFEGARGAVPQLEHVRGHAVGVGRREALHGRDFGIGESLLICLGDARRDLFGGVVGQQSGEHLAGQVEIAHLREAGERDLRAAELIAHI